MTSAPNTTNSAAGPPPDNSFVGLDIPLPHPEQRPPGRAILSRVADAANITVPPWVFNRGEKGDTLNTPARVRIAGGRMPDQEDGPLRSRPCVAITAVGAKACQWLRADGPALAVAVKADAGTSALQDRWSAGVCTAQELPSPSSYWIPDFVWLKDPKATSQIAARAALCLPSRNIDPDLLRRIAVELSSTLTAQAEAMGLAGLPPPEITGLRVHKTVPKLADGDPFYSQLSRISFALNWTLSGVWHAGRLCARGHGRLIPGTPPQRR